MGKIWSKSLLPLREKCPNTGPEKTPYLDTFHTASNSVILNPFYVNFQFL